MHGRVKNALRAFERLTDILEINRMKSTEEIKKDIEKAMLIIDDFWSASEEDQLEALETASMSFRTVLRLLEREGG